MGWQCDSPTILIQALFFGLVPPSERISLPPHNSRCAVFFGAIYLKSIFSRETSNLVVLFFQPNLPTGSRQLTR
jgi:hypothetical protein